MCILLVYIHISHCMYSLSERFLGCFNRRSTPKLTTNFLFSNASRPALGPTQTIVQYTPVALGAHTDYCSVYTGVGQNNCSVKLTIHPIYCLSKE